MVPDAHSQDMSKSWPQLETLEHKGFGHYKVRHEKNTPTFHYTGWVIGIFIMAYYNPYIAG